jgi:putative component of membrane protein insertase Oxa1/YidC/SpoIIIJ protein YidD
MQSTNQRGIIATVMTRSITFSEFLDTIGLQKFTDSLVDFAIRDYQRYISPHKGFSCAHCKLHGGSSCSGYFREIVAIEGLTKSLQLFPNRLAECREAYLILQSRKLAISKEDPEKSTSKKDKKTHRTGESECDCDDACDAYDCCDTLTNNNSLSCDSCDTNGDGSCDGGDCSGCDGGGCDGGCCDCSF